MQATYVVLGAARSGTSLCAGFLNILGVEMDYTLGAPDRFAPKGYYESKDANDINRLIYRRAWRGQQGYRDDPVSYYWFPPRRQDVLQQSEAVADKIQAFASRHAHQEKWGFKNPPCCLTLDLYLPYLVNPHLIVVLRNFEENVEACSPIFNLPEDYARKTLGYYLHCLQLSLAQHDAPSIIVRYEEFKTEHASVARRLAEFCAIDITPDQHAQIDGFVIKEQFGVDKYKVPP